MRFFVIMLLAIGLVLAGCELSGSGQPDLTGTVTIDKTSPKVGDILTATYTGNGTGAASWQWHRGSDPISGAATKTYTVVAEDLGKSLWAQVSYKDQKGAVASAATAATAAAAPTAPTAPAAKPSLTGKVTINNTTPKVGDKLTAAYSGNGTGTITWEWYLGSTVIRRSTNTAYTNLYTVGGDDAGEALSVRVSTNEQYGSIASAPTSTVVDERVSLNGTVTINNITPKVGDRITATYTGNGTGYATWQWLQGNDLINDAAANIYTVVATDLGKTLKAQVSYMDQKGSVTSVATAAVTAAGGNSGGAFVLERSDNRNPH